MKKLLALLIFGTLCSLSLMADPPASKKTAIVYFSATETTAKIAKETASAMGADVFHIIPAEPYTAADMSLNDKNARASLEAADKNARPAMSEPIDISPYSQVVLFYPIWKQYAPKVVYTFVESQNWEGKKLVTLCTSAGSGLGRSGTELAKIATGADYRGGRDISKQKASVIKKYLAQVLK